MSLLRECPSCHASYANGEKFCGIDRTPLVDRPPPAALPGLSRERPEDLIGQVFGERFTLKAVLSITETAVVYRATHCRLEKDFAVKLMRRAWLRNDAAVRRFLREARVASTVDHPHVVSIYDFGQIEGEPYLVMEFVDGPTLREVINQTPGQRLPVSQALDLSLQLVRALIHIHKRGVIHRNIKPENLVLTHRDGHADFVKLLALGVARRAGDPSLTQGGEVIGTAEFIAPEAWSWSDSTPPHPAQDLYALGVLLHIMIAGRPPFVGERGDLMMAHLSTEPPRLSVQARSIDIPKDLDALCARLLSKDPALRPDATAALEALEQVQAQLPPQSLRSLLFQQTLILSPHERDTHRKNPEPPAAKEPPPTVQTARSQRETVQLDRAARETVVAPEHRPQLLLLSQIDALEDQIDRARRRAAELSDALGERIWGRSWPAEAQALRTLILAQESQEESLGIQMAMLQEQLQQVREGRQAELAALRRHILGLSERLRGPAVMIESVSLRLDEGDAGPPPAPIGSEAERLAIAAALAEAEGAYAAGERSADLDDLAAALAAQQQQLQEVRNDVQQSWMRLAKLVLLGTPTTIPERRKLEQQIDQVERESAALAKLLSGKQ